MLKKRRLIKYKYYFKIISFLAITLFVSQAISKTSQEIWNFKPQIGYIEDTIAFDAKSEQLAFVYVHGSERFYILVLETKSFKRIASFKIEASSFAAKQLAFTPDGKRLILIWQAEPDNKYGATLFHIKEQETIDKVELATFADIITYENNPIVTLTNEKEYKNGAKRYDIRVFNTLDLNQIESKKVWIRSDQNLSTDNTIRFLYWEKGYITLMGIKKGTYDKQLDTQLPDIGVRYDILKNKIIWKTSPNTFSDWRQIVEQRSQIPTQNRILRFNENGSRLVSVNSNNQRIPIGIYTDWKLYDPQSLEQFESYDKKNIFFHIRRNPQRIENVSESIDLFQLSASSKITYISQVNARPLGQGWSVCPRFFAYLTKSEDFERGGIELKVFKRDK